MSKLSFRARQLDANKPLPVYRVEELPDLSDLSTINRAVPRMPTGMEKEEETEHHLQRAISAQQVYGDTNQLVIPTPQTKPVDITTSLVEECEVDFKIPKQYIHVQALGFEDEQPEYDLDEEDSEWLNGFNKDKEKLTGLTFEKLVDRLEKSSGNEALSFAAAKSLMKDEEFLEPVYNYWVKKHRKSSMNGLILQLKSEKKDAQSPNDPYIAFRRRIEKMQTRKNRKNEELSYEKMLKLRRDLNTACTILDMVKRREQTKKDALKITVDIFDCRYKVGDFNGVVFAQCLDLLRIQNGANAAVYNTHTTATGNKLTPGSDTLDKDERVDDAKYRKGDHLVDNKRKQRLTPQNIGSPYNQPDQPYEPDDDTDHPDGLFAFKRRKGCRYLAPRVEGNWPWESPGHPRYKYSLTSLSRPSRLIGYARRRVGRGGRVLIDRTSSSLDNRLEELGSFLDSSMSLRNSFHYSNQCKEEFKPTWRHYRPRSPYALSSMDNNSNSTANTPVYKLDDLSHERTIEYSEHGYKPRSKVRRTFSTQPNSKFTLNSGLSNGVTPGNVTATILGRTKGDVIPNGHTVNNNNTHLWNGTNLFSPHKNAFSTAPVNAVYALNFPIPSSNSGTVLPNSLLKAANKHSSKNSITSRNLTHRLNQQASAINRSNSVEERVVTTLPTPSGTPVGIVNGGEIT